MRLKKEIIKVGSVSLQINTIPVNVIFDLVIDSQEMSAERFQILEMDGYHLVIRERVEYDVEEEYICTQDFKCFPTAKSAWDYLSLFGIDQEDADRKSDEEPFDV